MGWFLRVMEELGITCRVGDATRILAVETRRQKHDRRDARLLLTLLTEERFPTIWMPSAELRDLRALLRHRDQWVRMRTRVKNALQGVALAHGIRRGAGLWSRDGQAMLAALPCRRTRAPAGQSCKRSTTTSPRTSRRWISTSSPKRTSARRPPPHDASGRGPGQRTVPTIVPETRQNSVSRAYASQLARSVKRKE